MTASRTGRATFIVIAASWLCLAAAWTHGFRAFTNFSAAREAAGPLPRHSPALPVVDERGERWDVGAESDQLRLVQAMYLRCPDVCPIAMSRLGRIRSELGDLVPNRVRIVSLSVDHDSPSALGDMWRAHGSPAGWSMAALTTASIEKTLGELGVWMLRRPDGLINHGVDILLLDRGGRVVQIFFAEDDASAIATAVKRHLS